MKTRPWIDVSELLRATDPEAENAVMAASYVLFMLSGQRFGGIYTTTEQYLCETTGAPVGCSWDPGEKAYWNSVLGVWAFVQAAPGGRRYGPGGDIRLRGRPVRRIIEVEVDGEVVDPSQYDLYNRAVLRTRAGMSWGLCSSPTITYEYGTQPSTMGKMAARRLADEFVKAFNGEECELPSSVTSVSRQGLSFSIFDPQDFLKEGRIGLYEVDLFLSAVNPSRARKRPAVFSPDLPRPYRQS